MKHLLLACALAALVGQSALAQTLNRQAQAADIDFGDDSGQFSNDGECDDPRFAGEGMADSYTEDEIMKDASDCQALLASGDIRVARTQEESNVSECAAIDYGNDTSEWANDNECDDGRFIGPGVDNILNLEDQMSDATDCRALCESGDIWLR
jgi:hypothetical protein